MTGLDPELLVSISAGGKRGSGYLLTPNLVLTAGHCVQSAGTTATVRRLCRYAEDRYALMPDEGVAFRVEIKNDLDFALLTRAEDTDPFAIRNNGWPGDVRLGRLFGKDRVPAQALGFPESQVDKVGPKNLMNVEDARGSIFPMSGSREFIQSLNFQIETGTSPTRSGTSLWSGMSGAALFSGDHLVGVIVRDRATIEGRLLAVPINLIFGADGDSAANECLLRARGEEPTEQVKLDPVWSGDELLRPAYLPLPPPDQWSEADLLQARYSVVPFQGRVEELAGLADWCRLPGGCRLRLLTGGGAVGKTRLSRELCRQMAAESWVTGIADPLEVNFSKFCDFEEKRLIVVDDADTHAGQLEALLATAAETGNRLPLRILAVAQSGGMWWKALKRRYEALVDEQDPAPLDPPEKADREEVYNVAFDAFKSWYQQRETTHAQPEQQPYAVPGSEVVARAAADAGAGAPNLESPDFASYLLILIQALVDARASLGKTPSATAGPPSRSRSDALLDYAIDVQRQRWQESARNVCLPDDPVLLERVVAISSLAVATGRTEGEGETEAARRLRLVPDLADEPEWRRRGFARWQHAEFIGEGYLRSLQPLRLAERLGARVIATFPDLARQLLDVDGKGPGIPRSTSDRSRQVLKVLRVLQLTTESDASSPDGTAPTGEAMKDAPAQKVARKVMEQALRDHAAPIIRLVKQVAMTEHDESAAAIGASLVAALNTTLRKKSAQEVAAQVLKELDVPSPDVLLELAVAVAEHAVQHFQRINAPHTEENRDMLATALQRLSHYLASSGQRRRACEVAWEAVDTYRALQPLQRSEEHQFGLAEALSDLADRLDDAGQFEEAHERARESVQLLEQMRQDSLTRRQAFGLAKALCTQATTACHIGRPREALHVANEAYDVIERLSEVRETDEYQPDDIKGKRAFVLRGFAWQLGESGRWAEALAKAQESCELYEELRQHCSTRWHRDHAQALSEIGQMYAATEQWDKSIRQHARALENYNILERQYSEAVRPQHAMALFRMATGYLGRAGSWQDGNAGEALREAEGQEDLEEALEEFRQNDSAETLLAELARKDLKSAQDKVEEALAQYDNLHPEDSWANRLHKAKTHCLKANVLVATGRYLRSQAAADSKGYFSHAKSAAQTALSLYDEVGGHTWSSRRDRAHTQAVLAAAYEGLGRPKAAILQEYQRALNAFDELDAEEPGLVDEDRQEIRTIIEEVRHRPGSHHHRPRSGSRSRPRRPRH
ncbi:hypothetical protein [Kitasatospora sp. NPDC059673]|uniref:S1 family peptidase n=1 Tax=Kitasatospora sp. NPDC059673 TaxID=3346901 RepID=UPI0036751595